MRYFNIQFIIQHAISKQSYWNIVARAVIFVQSVRVIRLGVHDLEPGGVVGA